MDYHILIVDDEKELCVSLSEILMEEGYPTVYTSDPRETPAILARTHVDLIILDIRMPGMDGLQTLAQMKMLDPGMEVIMLTGHASVDAAMEINRLGGFDYLLKPCPLEDLLLKIEAAYEKKLDREKRSRAAARPEA